MKKPVVKFNPHEWFDNKLAEMIKDWKLKKKKKSKKKHA